ncbi:MAG: hypothetical protein ACOYI1_07880 [Caldicoprobacteraceae bacterium]|jgi:hypothetical protein
MRKAIRKNRIKKIVIPAVVLIISAFLINAGYGLWSSRAEVRFRLTIWWPADYECVCGTYATIQEGIILLRDHQYNKIRGRTEAFDAYLRDRIQELGDLPYGGITFNELAQELSYYRSVLMANLRGCVDQYAECINGLTGFYNNSSQQEKNEVPDFWDQQRHLWDLQQDLWKNRVDPLYDLINELESVGQSKINWDNE